MWQKSSVAPIFTIMSKARKYKLVNLHNYFNDPKFKQSKTPNQKFHDILDLVQAHLLHCKSNIKGKDVNEKLTIFKNRSYGASVVA